MIKRFLALSTAMVLLFGMSTTAFAADNATVTFTSKQKLTYSNVSDEQEDGSFVLGSGFENVAPGETRSQTITLQNKNKRTADFYMNASVIKALEESQKSASGAAYDITLTAGEATLYDSSVGGYQDSTSEGSTEGMKEMNAGALAGYLLAGTLKQDESMDVVLTISFDGEAMDNDAAGVDYSNTLGQIGFQFKVSYEDAGKPEVVYKEVTKSNAVKHVKQIIEEIVPLAAVQTGDSIYVFAGIGILLLAAGIILVVVGSRKAKEERS